MEKNSTLPTEIRCRWSHLIQKNDSALEVHWICKNNDSKSETRCSGHCPLAGLWDESQAMESLCFHYETEERPKIIGPSRES